MKLSDSPQDPANYYLNAMVSFFHLVGSGFVA